MSNVTDDNVTDENVTDKNVTYTDITYELNGSTALITLNRPKQMNSWTNQMAKEVRHAMARAEGDKDVMGIVVTGSGRGFCAGADMGDLQKMQKAGGLDGAGSAEAVDLSAEPGQLDLPEGFNKGAFTYFATISKPVIAAVNGAVAGVGFPLILFCDMRFFGESGFVASTFPKRGLIAEGGSAWILPKLVGLDVAFDILWTSRKIYGPEAKELRLATRVCPDDELVNEAVAYINDLAKNCSATSIAGMKGQAYRDLYRDPTEAFKEAHGMMKQTLKHPDFKEGIKSFMEKRLPIFAKIGK